MTTMISLPMILIPTTIEGADKRRAEAEYLEKLFEENNETEIKRN